MTQMTQMTQLDIMVERWLTAQDDLATVSKRHNTAETLYFQKKLNRLEDDIKLYLLFQDL